MHSDGAETALQERGGAGHPRTLQTAARLSAVSSDTPVLRRLPSHRDSETQVNASLASTVRLVGGGLALSLGTNPLATPATGEVPPAGAECHVLLTGPPAKQGRSHVPPWGRREPPRSSGLRPQHCCRGSPPVWRNGSDWRSWRSPGRCCRDSGQGWGADGLGAEAWAPGPPRLHGAGPHGPPWAGRTCSPSATGTLCSVISAPGILLLPLLQDVIGLVHLSGG